VQPANPLRSRGLHRQLDDRKGRRVRRDDRVRVHDRVQFAKDRALDLEILDDGLDDEVAIREIRQVRRPRDSSDDRSASSALRLPLSTCLASDFAIVASIASVSRGFASER